jgi:hypothetical protein
MNKLTLAVIYVVTCSYFSNPIQSAEASGRHSAHVSKHIKPTIIPTLITTALLPGMALVFMAKEPLMAKDLTCMQ